MTKLFRPTHWRLAQYFLVLIVFLTLGIFQRKSSLETFEAAYFPLVAWISLFGVWIFYILWIHMFEEEALGDRIVEDWGFPCFILGIACWMMPHVWVPQKDTNSLELIKHIASHFNNAFVLSGIPYLEFKSVKWDRRAIRFRNLYFRLLIFVMTLAIVLFVPEIYADKLDVIGSIITCTFLCVSLGQIFVERLAINTGCKTPIPTQVSPFLIPVCVTWLTIIYVQLPNVHRLLFGIEPSKEELLFCGILFKFELIVLWTGLVFSRHRTPRSIRFKSWLYHLLYKTDRGQLHEPYYYKLAFEKWINILCDFKQTSHHVEFEFESFGIRSEENSHLADHFKSISPCKPSKIKYKLSIFDIYVLSKVAFFNVFWALDAQQTTTFFREREVGKNWQPFKQRCFFETADINEFIKLMETMFSFFRDIFFHRNDRNVQILKELHCCFEKNTGSFLLAYGVRLDDPKILLEYLRNGDTNSHSLSKNVTILKDILGASFKYQKISNLNENGDSEKANMFFIFDPDKIFESIAGA